MKPSISRRTGEQGNLILVALIIGGIAGITLGSYLIMAQQQNLSIYRSQTWNTTMPVTEAGVEDGLQLINYYAGSFEPTDIYKWTNIAPAAGWDIVAPNTYHVQRSITNGLPPGAQASTYEVWIYNTNNMPFVRAVGTVPWVYQTGPQAPLISATIQPLFAQIGNGGGTTVQSTQGLLYTNGVAGNTPRCVGVQTLFNPLFVVAMAAVGYIDLHGNNVATDSFDSGDPLYSNNGQYPTGNPNRTKAHGDVCTDAGLMDSLNIGNADIKGSARTGPGTNTFNWNNNASVGDRAWVEGGNHGVQPGHFSADFNVAFDPVNLPTNSNWMPIGGGTVNTNGVNYQKVITTGGYYEVSSLNQSMLIRAPSNDIINIKINGNVTLAGNDRITIEPTGAQVRIYMVGSTFSMTGSASIENKSGIAYNFLFYGLPSCTSIELGGNSSFYGGIYAPSADFTLGGGGNNALDFVGGSVTKTVHMNGHFNFHFDEDLARRGPCKGFVPTAWREI